MSEQGTTVLRAVTAGYYSLPEGSNDTLRYDQTVCPLGYYCVGGVKQACPAGTYGNTTGLGSKECSGQCRGGYFCPLASVNDTQFPCGNDSVYCPTGSGTPMFAQPGDVTTGGTNSTHDGVDRCPERFYCVNGSQIVCPAGQFGCATGLGTAECNGPCSAGFYCPPGSSSNHMAPCGNSSVFCPPGSSLPVVVAPGNYSTGGSVVEQRSDQAVCPPGSYCINGNLVSCRVVCCGIRSPHVCAYVLW